MTDLSATLAAMRERASWLCRVDIERLVAAVEAVVARHKPAVFGDAPDVRYCTHCQASGDPFAPTGRTWPCPTIRTLTDALDGES